MITKEVTIWCDAHDCLQWIDGGNDSVDRARKEARRKGWTFPQGLDLCPKHSRNHGNPA